MNEWIEKNSAIKLEAGRSCCTDITGTANFYIYAGSWRAFSGC